jgi:hypothetical protein
MNKQHKKKTVSNNGNTKASCIQCSTMSMNEKHFDYRGALKAFKVVHSKAWVKAWIAKEKLFNQCNVIS